MSIDTNSTMVMNRIFRRPNLLGERSEQDRAEQLADIAGRDDHADLGRRELPLRNQLRHREGDRQHRVGVEERRDADDHAQQHQPAA